jgi:DNA mismatch endonuclease (patch repair protein)
VDVFTPEKRSRVMAAIRSKGNRSTELRLITVFREHKVIGWRRGYQLYGKPDFVFPRQKVAIFVDGCFWHGCKRCFRMPTTNVAFWVRKIGRNKTRDKEVGTKLKKEGWKVLRLSECIFKTKCQLLRKLSRVIEIMPTRRR